MTEEAGKLFAVVGDPIAHSKSPLMHTAAYRALGMVHRYERIHAKPGEIQAVVARLRSGEYAGLNITVPYKTRVLELVETLAPSAVLAGAANTLVRGADGGLVAHNTDAPALAAELDALARQGLRGTSALVLGTGGGARAAIVALLSLGVGHVVCRGRRLADSGAANVFRAELVSLVARAGAVATVEVGPLEARPDDARFAVVVQATSAGMTGAAPGEVVVGAVDFAALPPSAVALDLVYSPATTPFLDAASSRGIAHTNGIGMLVRQGALAFELWLGVAPPLDVMRAALG